MKKALAERGSLAIEFAIIVPIVFVAFVALVIYAGRVAQAENEVQSAAHAAARAATLLADPAAASAVAHDVGTANLASAGRACAGGSSVVVGELDLNPGGVVEVTVSCTASLADLLLLGVPSQKTFTATAREVVDVYRSDS